MAIFKKLKTIFKNPKKSKLLAVFLIYFVLTLVFAAPIIANVRTSIPGGHGDAIQVLGGINRLKNNIDFSSAEGISQFLYSFVKSPLKIFSTYFYRALLAKFLGEIVAYNLIWISSFFLAAVFMFLLAKHITKNTYAAFLAGFLFSFAPTHFAYGNGFAGATHIEWLPLFVLFFVKLLKKFSYKNLFLSLMVFAIIAQSEHHYVYFMLLFAVGLVIFYFVPRIRKKEIKRNEFIKYGISGVALVCLTAFIFFGMLKISLSGDNYLKVSLNDTIPNSLDLFHFLTPNLNHLVWGDFFKDNTWPKLAEVKDLSRDKVFAEVSGFLTYTALFFAVMMVIRHEKFKRSKEIFLYIVLAVTFFLLSMGPILSVHGPITPAVPLPFILLFKYLPFMDNIRAIGRFFPFGLLAFSIVFAFGFLLYFSKIKKRQNKFIFTAAIFTLLLVELLYLPPMIEVKTPNFIEFLKQDQGDYKVLNIGSSSCYVCASQYGYYNSLHDKKAVGGMFYARQAHGFELERTTPFVKELLYFLPKSIPLEKLSIDHDYRSFTNEILTENNIKYIAFDKEWINVDGKLKRSGDNFISTLEYLGIKNFIESNLDYNVFINDADFIVYEVLPSHDKDYVLLRQEESTKNQPVTDKNTELEEIPLFDGEKLILENYTGKDVKIFLPLKFKEDYTGSISVEINGTSREFYLNREYSSFSLLIPNRKERSEIVFRIPDGQEVRATRINYHALKISDYIASLKDLRLGSQEMLLPHRLVFFDERYQPLENEMVFRKNDFERADFGKDHDDLFYALLKSKWLAGWRFKARQDIRKPEYYINQALKPLRENGIEYIVLDKDFFGEHMATENFLILTKVFSKVIENDNFSVYKISQEALSEETLPEVNTMSGFSPLIEDGSLKADYLDMAIYRGVADSTLIFSHDVLEKADGFQLVFEITSKDGGYYQRNEEKEMIEFSARDTLKLDLENDLSFIRLFDKNKEPLSKEKGKEYFVRELRLERKSAS